MKIQSTTPNPMFGINNNNTLHNRKTAVNDTISDIANMQERKDMYVPKDRFEDATSENTTYDKNGQLPKFYQGKELNTKNIDPAIDFSKINGIVSELYERKPSEEETRLLNLSMRINGMSFREYTQTRLELGNALNLTCIDQDIDELYAMYDKKFGTDSSDKVKYFKMQKEQSANVSKMLNALHKALDAGKTRDDIMEFAPDDSFSKDDFDYIMNIVDNYDYQNHKLTDKDAVKTNNSNVSSDLSNVLAGMFA